MKLPKLTIILVLLLVAVHLALSSNLLFPRPEKITELGFSISLPQNILPYNFVHTDYSHLIVNLAIIAAGGIVIESRLGKKDFLALFFAGSAFSAILLVLLDPSYLVIGSSAGATSLVAAAFTVDTKKTILNTVVLVAIAIGVIAAGNFYVGHTSKKLGVEISGLQIAGQIAEDQNNYPLVAQIEKQIETKNAQIGQFDKGIETKNSIPPGFEIHLFAALFGISYCFLFAEKELFRNTREISGTVKQILRS